MIVGVNDFVQEDEPRIETLYIDEATATRSSRSSSALQAVARWRARCRRALDAMRGARAAPRNVMPPILDAVRAYATVGEMCDALRDVWGEYEEVPVI